MSDDKTNDRSFDKKRRFENNDDFFVDELNELYLKYGAQNDDASKDMHPTIRPPADPPKNNRPASIPKIICEEDADGIPHFKTVTENSNSEQKIVLPSETKNTNGYALPLKSTSKAAGKSNAGEQIFSDQFKQIYEEVRRENTTRTESDEELAHEYSRAEELRKRAYSKTYNETKQPEKKSFFAKIFPVKGDGAKESIRKIIMLVSAVVVICCLGYFVNDFVDHNRKKRENESLIRNLPTDSIVDEEELRAKWAAIKAKYPNVVFPEGMNIKFAESYAHNQDLVGRITIPGMTIDTLIVQHKEDRNHPDREDFYLHRSWYKQWDKYGIAFLDKYCTGSSLDKNNTIYGHNMSDGLMFNQLTDYYDIKGYKHAPIIKYSTLFNDYTFKIFAVMITNGYPAGDGGYLFDYTTPNFPTKENFKKYLDSIKERTIYFTGVDVNENDTLLTLSTCSYLIKTTDMGRVAIVARLLRKGESTSIDETKVKVNPNPRYPQVWYDERGISNPFAGSYKWKATD